MSIANEITRLQNAKASLKSSINSKTDAQHQITVEKLEEYADFVDSISTGGSTKLFTGHYDTEGLRTIGWTDKEIQYYQDKGVQWNEEEDSLFELNSTELEGDYSKNTRFIPKNTTKNNFNEYRRLLAIPQLDTSKVTNMNSMFDYCSSLTTIPQLDTSKVTNMNSMFGSCSSLTTIPLIDTSNVTNMRGMFQTCHSLTTIPLLDTSNVTNMSYMFNGCSSLKVIPQLDTSKVDNMDSMFGSCYSLKVIPQLDTSNVTNMSYMLSNCSSLTTIPQLDTSKVTNMKSMFGNCYSLTTIPQLDTSNVTNMSYMFGYCSSLTTIPQLDTSKVTNMNSMLSNCSTLEIIGGFINLGQAYSTSQTDNYSYYTIDMSSCTMLTEQSLINVLNRLYDIASKGCNTQSVVLGSTNLAKLTSQAGQQALSNAQTKGWNIS